MPVLSLGDAHASLVRSGTVDSGENKKLLVRLVIRLLANPANLGGCDPENKRRQHGGSSRLGGPRQAPTLHRPMVHVTGRAPPRV